MDRISTSTRAVSLHGAGKDGFTDGNPAVAVPATNLDAAWFNGVQETLLHPIEAAGLTPQANDPTQLTQAIRALTATALVRQPANVTPAAGASGVDETPTLTGSTYYSLYGVPQGSARFEVSQSEDFDTVLHAHTVAGAATSYTVPSGVLTTASVYWWRGRYQDAEGNWSLWSAPTGFTTGAVFSYVARPTITAPANNASGISVTPTFTFTAFSVVGATDTHDATQVQIATDAAFATVIHDSGVAGQPATAYTVPAAAALPTLYIVHVRVRHHAIGLGWSQWATAVRFQVQARAAAPVITSPTTGATGVSRTMTITTSGFSVPGGADSHVASQYQIGTSAAFTTVVHDSGAVVFLTSYGVPAGAGLAPLTTYHVRARHQGAATGWSDWSAAVTFTTAEPSGSQAFTTSGTFTVPTGVTRLKRVICIGPGGRSSSWNGSGGGGYARKSNIDVTPGQTFPVNVAFGQTTSFGSILSATPGGDATGTNPYPSGVAGTGGAGVGGDVNARGGDGASFWYVASNSREGQGGGRGGETAEGVPAHGQNGRQSESMGYALRGGVAVHDEDPMYGGAGGSWVTGQQRNGWNYGGGTTTNGLVGVPGGGLVLVEW